MREGKGMLYWMFAGLMAFNLTMLAALGVSYVAGWI
jgi:hypothetical protein